MRASRRLVLTLPSGFFSGVRGVGGGTGVAFCSNTSSGTNSNSSNNHGSTRSRSSRSITSSRVLVLSLLSGVLVAQGEGGVGGWGGA